MGETPGAWAGKQAPTASGPVHAEDSSRDGPELGAAEESSDEGHNENPTSEIPKTPMEEPIGNTQGVAREQDSVVAAPRRNPLRQRRKPQRYL